MSLDLPQVQKWNPINSHPRQLHPCPRNPLFHSVLWHSSPWQRQPLSCVSPNKSLRFAVWCAIVVFLGSELPGYVSPQSGNISTECFPQSRNSFWSELQPLQWAFLLLVCLTLSVPQFFLHSPLYECTPDLVSRVTVIGRGVLWELYSLQGKPHNGLIQLDKGFRRGCCLTSFSALCQVKVLASGGCSKQDYVLETRHSPWQMMFEIWNTLPLEL